jgi:DNA-binding MarR family transcriptional regulator
LKRSARKPQSAKPLDINEFLCFSIYSANHAFNRVYHPLLRKLGLTYPQFIAMISLWAKDRQTVTELGEGLYLQSNTLTPMLKRLEAQGYIVRARGSDDERQVRITLTAAGRALQAHASDVIQEVRRATGLTDGEMEKMLASVGTLRASLGKIPS